MKLITRKPHFIYSHLDRLLLSCVFSTCWSKESFCSFFLPISSSVTAWLGLLDLRDWWRDLKMGRLKESQDQGTGLKWRLGFFKAVYPSWQKRRSDKKINSLLLFSCHWFLILLFRNPNIPAVKSHCWILFPTSLCWEHIETNTHGDCYPFKRPCNPTSLLSGLAFFFFPDCKTQFISRFILTAAVISVHKN